MINGTSNVSCHEWDVSCVYSAIEILYTVGILANLVVIHRVIMDRKLRDSTFVAIAALAVADLLFLTLNLAVSFEKVIVTITCGNSVVISIPYYVLKTIFWFAANGHVALLAILRYVMIAFPMKSNAYLRPKRVIVLSLVVWVVGTMITMILTGLIGAKVIHPGKSEDFLIILWIFTYLLPLIVTSFLHGWKIFIVRKMTRETATEATRKSIQRMSKIVIVVIVMAAILPLPRLVTKFLNLAGKDAYPSETFEKHFMGISELLFLLNNFINPLLYGFLSNKFRNSVKELFHCETSQADDSVATTDTPLSVRKQNYCLESMPKKASVGSIDSVGQL